MSWQLLITIQTFTIAVGVLMIRAAAKRPAAAKSLFAINAIQSFIFFFGGLFLVPLLGHVEYSNIWHYIRWFIAGGILAGLGNAFTFKLMSHLDAGFSTILGTLSTVFTIFFANIILHERLSGVEGLGATILLGAVCYGILVARDHHKKTKHSNAWKFGLLFGVAAAVLQGLGDVNQKFVLDHMNVASYMPVAAGMQTIMSILLVFIFEPKGFAIIKDRVIMRISLIGGLSRSLAGTLFLLALVKNNNIAVIDVVENFRLVVIILLAAIVLKEYERLGQKFVAAMIAIIGLSIIFSM